MNLTIIGAGYVGLVTGAVFSDFGNKVRIIEIDQEKIKKLKKGEVPFYEPGLKELVAKNTAKKNLQFTNSYQEAIPKSEIIFVCVGTPTKNLQGGKPDLSYLYEATKSIAENLKEPAIIVVKSTVPPGTNMKLAEWMKKFTKVDFNLASVPEFLKEGTALEDSFHPSRVVIGAENKLVIKKLLLLHKKIPGKRLICNSSSAQMIKYASNTFLPMKITFANSLAILCEKLGADIKEVTKGMGMDKRIGPLFLDAGLGYGGSCFPKDIAALVGLAENAGFDFKLMKAVQKTNEEMINHFVRKTEKLCQGSIKDKVIVVLGLAFKPGTSDMRESRSVSLIKELQKKGALIRACDPVAIPEAKKLLTNVEYFLDPYKALEGADVLMVGSGPYSWEEYKNLDFVKLKKIMKGKVVIDSWNIYNKDKLKKLGFTYEGIGR